MADGVNSLKRGLEDEDHSVGSKKICIDEEGYL